MTSAPKTVIPLSIAMMSTAEEDGENMLLPDKRGKARFCTRSDSEPRKMFWKILKKILKIISTIYSSDMHKGRMQSQN